MRRLVLLLLDMTPSFFGMMDVASEGYDKRTLDPASCPKGSGVVDGANLKTKNLDLPPTNP